MAGNKRSNDKSSSASRKPAGKAPTVTMTTKSTKPAAASIKPASASMQTAVSASAKSAPSAAKASAAAPAPAAKKTPSKPSKMMITSEERQRMIAEAAYYIAEKRGFQGGNCDQDWLEAAAQIDRIIMGSTSRNN